MIEFRISLQDKEREMADLFLGAYAFNQITTPIVDLLKDVTGLITLFTLMAALGLTGISFKFTPDDDSSLESIVDSFFTQREQEAIARGLEISTLATGNPLFRLFRQWGGFEL